MSGLAGIAAVAIALALPPRPDDAVGAIDGRPLARSDFAEFVLSESGAAERADALDQLIREKLVEIESKRRGILVLDRDVEARRAELERNLREQSKGRAGLADHLASLGVTAREFDDLLRKSIACERMMAADFGLPGGTPVPPEKQSLWFQELRARESVRTESLPREIAALVGEERISRIEWGMALHSSLADRQSDRLFEEFVGVEILLAEGRARGLEVTATHVAREVQERTAALQARLRAEGMATEGVDYLETLRARGDDPDEVLEAPRFRAEILLKELTRARHGADGFRAFYEARRAEFDAAFGRRVHLSTIFLAAAAQRGPEVRRTFGEASEELAGIADRVQRGDAPVREAFQGLARLRSEHESAARGGDLGRLGRAELERAGLPETLLDASAGALLGPLPTPEGVHLLLVHEPIPAAAFAEIAGEVEKAARREVLRELKAKHAVERRV